MGLATPAAIAVGLGRAGKKMVSYLKMPNHWSYLKISKQIVFDKTGTLTTGKFEIADFSFGGY